MFTFRCKYSTTTSIHINLVSKPPYCLFPFPSYVFPQDDLAIAEQVLRERGIVEEKNGRDDGTACSSERYRQSLEGGIRPPSTPRPFRGL